MSAEETLNEIKGAYITWRHYLDEEGKPLRNWVLIELLTCALQKYFGDEYPFESLTQSLSTTAKRWKNE